MDATKNSLWERAVTRLIVVGGTWGPIAAIVGIFTVGAAVPTFLYERFDKTAKPEDVTKEVKVVDDKVVAADARISRVVEFVKAEDAKLITKQESTMTLVLNQYSALNARIDAQNSLLLRAIENLPRKKSAADRTPDAENVGLHTPAWFYSPETMQGGT